MKSYAQITFGAFQRGVGITNQREIEQLWEAEPDHWKTMWGTVAKAVIEEFKRRHNIVITPEED